MLQHKGTWIPQILKMQHYTLHKDKSKGKVHSFVHLRPQPSAIQTKFIPNS
jgi:hypothetical protein